MLENANVQEINKAILILRELSADEHMRQIAEMREKALHDEASAQGNTAQRTPDGFARHLLADFSPFRLNFACRTEVLLHSIYTI